MAAPTSKAPRPWRADQVQRLSEDRRPAASDSELLTDAVPVVMAGLTIGDPPDSPDARIDENSPASPYSGICSLHIERWGNSYLCSATPISPRHILSAAHCLDGDDDGQVDYGTTVAVTFNFDGDGSFVIPPEGIRSLEIHPDYTGFSNPTVNDDLAIITLVDPLPEEIPIYPPFRGELAEGEVVTMVGYGQSGSGNVGATVVANQFVKRTGGNAAEEFFAQDEDGDTLEVWRADFDHPSPLNVDCFGATSLGNAIETSAAPGDSGGPALVEVKGQLQLWGVNTFVSDCAGSATHFGAATGGIIVNAYLPWIDFTIECAGNCADCNDNGIADGIDIFDRNEPRRRRQQHPRQLRDGGGRHLALERRQLHRLLGRGRRGADDPDLGDTPREGLRLRSLGSAVRAGPDLRFQRTARHLRGRAGARRGARHVDHRSRRHQVADGRLVRPGRSPLRPEPRPESDVPTPRSLPATTRATGDLIDYFVVDDPDTAELENGGIIQASNMVFGPDGNLYVAEIYADGSIPRFDGQTGAFIDRFADGVPHAAGNANLAFRDGLLYVARFQSDVLRFDATTGAFVDTFIEVPEPPFILDFDWGPDGLFYLLSLVPERRLDRYDPVTGAFVDTLITEPILDTPGAFAFVPKNTPEPPAGDVDGNGQVNVEDMITVIVSWGDCPETTPCPADLNDDGAVNVLDLLLVILQWTE